MEDYYDHIGSGKEGDVYISKDKMYVLKVYKVPFKKEKIDAEINFLKNFQNSGVVPILNSYTDNTILMQYLDGYITLKTFAQNKRMFTPQQQEMLLMNIVNARRKLGENIYYKDMHPGNILINPTTLDVKFIDQGMWEIQDYGWLLNLKNIVEDLKMSRTKIGSMIMKNKIRELVG
jgi:serine/threonine protein kinase